MGWIIKLERDNPDRAHLLNPLTTRYHPQFPLPRNFPRVLDLMNLHVRELGLEYTLQYINYRPLATNIGDAGNLYMEKVAFCGKGEGFFVILTIHISGKLVLYKSGDKKWTVINDLVLSSPYDDVISRLGKFYAVDCNGRLVMVNLNIAVNNNAGGSDGRLVEPPALSLIADSVHGGDKKFLVEDGGDLLLVDKYTGITAGDDLGYYNEEGFESYEEFDCLMSERTLRFKVFRLDTSGGRWVEVSNLGSKIVFLGDNCTFSYDLSELDYGGCCRGNCILFTDQFLHSKEDDGVGKSGGIGVFDLETGNIGPISSFPGYSELFWPPPSWMYPGSSSSSVEVSNDAF
ncbi:OLC1v1003568C1 [Oldenlandia corymbosa var. corymbosa]|uniref:OLC1v1003568C1 n=1 Tax=Oldenlandia corymbosa var. corymbosa TaxID=529605 RepID=A0AAV1DCQ4_OLDCO|nr:OLC1v1003568C1 [Oldenlandia corymbosa var. corymbosa]